jgi:hypothetical protein
VPVSFSRKETGTSTTAAALIAQGFAAFPLVTIGVTNAIDLTRVPEVHLYHQRITALMQKPWSRHKDGGLNPAILEIAATGCP